MLYSVSTTTLIVIVLKVGHRKDVNSAGQFAQTGVHAVGHASRSRRGLDEPLAALYFVRRRLDATVSDPASIWHVYCPRTGLGKAGTRRDVP